MKKAFTMIELIFLIVILVAIPKLNSTTNEAKKSIIKTLYRNTK